MGDSDCSFLSSTLSTQELGAHAEGRCVAEGITILRDGVKI